MPSKPVEGTVYRGMRHLKSTIYDLLQMTDEAAAMEKILEYPAQKVINPLFSFIQHTDEPVKWRAVRAMGRVVSHMAENNIESARIVMRRLMWSLNDESGGIGWGAPEAMGEIMAQDQRLADEYHHMLISYLDEKGNYLEYEPLRRGAVWAVNRLCSSRPDMPFCISTKRANV